MSNIQLFGITETNEIKNWTELLDKALLTLDLDVSIEVVSDVKQFIEHNLRGIPALVIDDEVVFQKEIPTMDALKFALKERLDIASLFQ